MRARVLSTGFAMLVALAAHEPTALAHSAGQPGPGCVGCHAAGSYDIAVATNPSSFSPGAQVNVTVTISRPTGANAGLFVAAKEGTLGVNGGQGLAVVGAGLTHTSPKSMSGGKATFTFNWTAPSTPGAVRFGISTLVGNGNGSSSGDAATAANFDFVFGCSPATYFRDYDGDGFGADNLTLIHCDTAAPAGYARASGDCDDFEETTYPTAIEVCNQKDDDCDGEIDDEAIPVVLYPDADGDGHYGNDEFLTGETIMGCVPTSGYAAYPGDCAPNDPTINPSMEEVCNLIDDNCDERVDEYVRPRCGEGWCEREASTCDPATCIEGEPTPETCNLRDDDCDGVVDEGTLCAAGQSCVAAVCSEDPPAPVAESSDSGCAMTGRGGAGIGLGGLIAAMALLRRRAQRVHR